MAPKKTSALVAAASMAVGSRRAAGQPATDHLGRPIKQTAKGGKNGRRQGAGVSLAPDTSTTAIDVVEAEPPHPLLRLVRNAFDFGIGVWTGVSMLLPPGFEPTSQSICPRRPSVHA